MTIEDEAPALSEALTTAISNVTGPAIVLDRYGRIALSNVYGRGLLFDLFDESAPAEPSLAQYVFADERARGFFGDWDAVATDIAALLASALQVHPDDADLTAVVDGLRSTDEFERYFAAAAGTSAGGTSAYQHPLIGEVSVLREVMLDESMDAMLMMWHGTDADQDSRLGFVANWQAIVENGQQGGCGCGGSCGCGGEGAGHDADGACGCGGSCNC